MASKWFQRKAADEAPADPLEVLALGYLRVSTKKQDRGFSPEAQAKEVAAYVRQHGWEPGEVFRDTLQGTRDDRPDYRRMLEQVRFLRKQGRHVVVVAAALDRTGRDLAELFGMRKALRLMGVQLHYTRDGGELDDDSAMLKGWQAAKETEKLSIRVTASKRIAAEHGLPPAGATAWGYDLRLPRTPEEEAANKISKGVRRILDVNEVEAPYVRNLFKRAADGQTIGALSRWVASLPEEARGTTPDRHAPGERMPRVLGRSALLKVLRNPIYISRYTRDPEVDTADAILTLPKGRWPSLVGDDLWRRVQERLDSHRTVPRQASGDYLLTGFLRCPVCGGTSRMNAFVNGRSGRKGTGQRRRYRCVSSVLGGEAVAKRCFYGVTMELIDAHVLEQVGAVLDAAVDPKLTEDVRQAWDKLHETTTPATERAKKLDAEIERLRTRIRKAREDLYDDKIDQAEHDSLVLPWRAALKAREEARRTIVDEPTHATLSFDEAARKAGAWGKMLRRPGVSVESKREVLAELIERVEPVRVAFGKYEARITTWTDTGETLRQLGEIASAKRASERPESRTTSRVRAAT